MSVRKNCGYCQPAPWAGESGRRTSQPRTRPAGGGTRLPDRADRRFPPCDRAGPGRPCVAASGTKCLELEILGQLQGLAGAGVSACWVCRCSASPPSMSPPGGSPAWARTWPITSRPVQSTPLAASCGLRLPAWRSCLLQISSLGCNPTAVTHREWLDVCLST